MYSFVRQNLDGESENRNKSFSDSGLGGEKYKSYKCMYRLDLFMHGTDQNCSLGTSREPIRGEDLYTPTSTGLSV